MTTWSPNEFIYAVTTSAVLIVLSLGVLSAASEFFERRLVEWWTGKKIK